MSFEILRKRYQQGEIDGEEFKERAQRLAEAEMAAERIGEDAALSDRPLPTHLLPVWEYDNFADRVTPEHLFFWWVEATIIALAGLSLVIVALTIVFAVATGVGAAV